MGTSELDIGTTCHFSLIYCGQLWCKLLENIRNMRHSLLACLLVGAVLVTASPQRGGGGGGVEIGRDFGGIESDQQGSNQGGGSEGFSQGGNQGFSQGGNQGSSQGGCQCGGSGGSQGSFQGGNQGGIPEIGGQGGFGGGGGGGGGGGRG